MRRAFTSLCILLAACASPKGSTPAEEREWIQSVETKTLVRLYKEHPDTKSSLQKAPGYAVFDVAITKVPVVGGGGGFGVVVDNKPVGRTYMKVREFDLGAGYGVRKFQVVLIIHDTELLEEVKQGKWRFSAGAEAAAKVGDAGAAGAGGTADASDKFTPYLLTEAGVSVTATIKVMRLTPLKKLN